MKTRILALILALTLPLSSCDLARRTGDSIKGAWHSGKIPSTILIAVREAGIIAAKQVLEIAVSGQDFGTKRDYLQGFTKGLWEHSGEMLDANTIADLARVWTPDKPHWEEFAVNLSNDLRDRIAELGHPPTKEELAAIANEYALGIYVATEGTK